MGGAFRLRTAPNANKTDNPKPWLMKPLSASCGSGCAAGSPRPRALSHRFHTPRHTSVHAQRPT
eukprot:4233719-Prymnesium_polylepis.1